MPVYFITEILEPDVEPRRIKIGYSKSINQRKKTLQTGNSHELKLMGVIQSNSLENDKKIESILHNKYSGKNIRLEWFSLYPQDVMSILHSYSAFAYLDVTGSAYEIVGYDRKGIPEYAGAWEWGDIEPNEFCPICGWAAGWSYNENYAGSRCLQCGASEHDFERPMQDEP